MSLARPKSQIFTSLPSQINTFLAARSRWTHCGGRIQLNTWDFMLVLPIQGKVMTELLELSLKNTLRAAWNAKLTACWLRKSWNNGIKFGQWHKYVHCMDFFLIPYVLGGEELHPFGHLVAEAQKVIVGQSRRVADDQVHSASTWAEVSPQRPEEEKKARHVTLSGLSKYLLFCDFLVWDTSTSDCAFDTVCHLKKSQIYDSQTVSHNSTLFCWLLRVIFYYER